jgi:hypothetical protein
MTQPYPPTPQSSAQQVPQPSPQATPPHPPLGYAQPLGYAPPPPRNDLRTIAMQQKAIMYCILGYIVFVILQIALPFPLNLMATFGVLAAMITGAVFVFMLALSLHNTATGIILGILTLVPLVGLIVLLVINSKATTLLRSQGIQVGLMGAKTSQIPASGQLPAR